MIILDETRGEDRGGCVCVCWMRHEGRIGVDVCVLNETRGEDRGGCVCVCVG